MIIKRIFLFVLIVSATTKLLAQSTAERTLDVAESQAEMLVNIAKRLERIEKRLQILEKQQTKVTKIIVLERVSADSVAAQLPAIKKSLGIDSFELQSDAFVNVLIITASESQIASLEKHLRIWLSGFEARGLDESKEYPKKTSRQPSVDSLAK